MRKLMCVLFVSLFVSVVCNVLLYKQWKLTHDRSERFEQLCIKVQNKYTQLRREIS